MMTTETPPQYATPPPAAPPQAAAPMTVTLANKVRLWFAAGCQALAILFGLIMAGSFSYYSVSFGTFGSGGVTWARGDLLALFAWVLIFQIAAATLASISLYRFVRPRQTPQQPVRPGPSWPEPMESQQSAPAGPARSS